MTIVLWKSSEAKKPAWNRAKVFMGAAGRALTAVRHPCSEIHENLGNLSKSQKQPTNRWRSMKYDESRQKPGKESSKGFNGDSRLTLLFWNIMTPDARQTSDPIIESSSAGEVGGRGGTQAVNLPWCSQLLPACWDDSISWRVQWST